ncbi:hypothetical protein AGMMS4956_09580 [Bacteroidia bacterium]|nr:hypothetical protein AGMMS4956_09580 [Bacteroidia bacterium]
MKILSAKERLDMLLSELKITKNALSIKLGYKNNVVFSHISNGRNGFSADLASKIIKQFPQIDYEWLLTGTSAMLMKNTTSNTEHAEINVYKEIIAEQKEEITALNRTIGQLQERLNAKKTEILPRHKVDYAYADA